MKPEQQRIAIAEACGWHCNQFGLWGIDFVDGVSGSPPDYLNDLNAMHEAEKILTAQQRRSYVNCLFNLPVSECESNTFATAAQRAKAFLRTIGKWEEEL